MVSLGYMVEVGIRYAIGTVLFGHWRAATSGAGKALRSIF